MRPYLILISLFLSSFTHSQSVISNNTTNDSLAETTFYFDPTVLRIPGNTLPFGISIIDKNGSIFKTDGYLGGKMKWRNFKIEVVGGIFRNGKIKIPGSSTYKKNENIIVNVYSKKTKKLLLTKEIPYNYETEIHFLTHQDICKAPGNRIKFGIRTYYDNGISTDLWYSSHETLGDYFSVTIDGGYFARNHVMIFNEPGKINDHTVKLVAYLLKNHAIADTLPIELDYRDQYECEIRNDPSGRRSHYLQVYVDVYFENLINQELMDVIIKDTENIPHRYLINTNGGTIKITSFGRVININATTSALPYMNMIEAISIADPPFQYRLYDDRNKRRTFPVVQNRNN